MLSSLTPREPVLSRPPIGSYHILSSLRRLRPIIVSRRWQQLPAAPSAAACRAAPSPGEGPPAPLQAQGAAAASNTSPARVRAMGAARAGKAPRLRGCGAERERVRRRRFIYPPHLCGIAACVCARSRGCGGRDSPLPSPSTHSAGPPGGRGCVGATAARVAAAAGAGGVRGRARERGTGRSPGRRGCSRARGSVS